MESFRPAAYYSTALWTSATITGIFVTLEVEQGMLRGQEKISKFFPDKKYYSFESIPYAKPPIGPLRFKDPEEPEPWSGVRDAIAEELSAPEPEPGQPITVIDQFVNPPKPNDDCLYLDVDTPQIGEEGGKPVIVWIHPMRFTEESAFGPRYFGVGHYMVEDIVLVTVRYRHGVLGFLCLDHEEVPGNAGLKDQVMALKWVQRNIVKFGGDPNNITLYGHGIAGAFVHYHLMSPLSEGLFHRVIIQGDCALNPHAYTSREAAIEKAFRLGKVLEWDTENTDDLLEFLRAVPVTDLSEAARKTYDPGENQFGFGTAFVPCVEVPATDKSFLPLTPRELLKQGRFAKVPTMMGITNNEGKICIKIYNECPEIIDGEPHVLMAKVMQCDVGNKGPVGNLEPEAWVKEIENFYFGNGNPSIHELPNQFAKAVCDFSYHIGFDEAARIQLEHTEEPFYAFEFKLFQVENPMKPLQYGHHSGLYSENIVYHHLVKMWTSFAKTSNPNNEEVDVIWEPARRDSFCYLQISSYPVVRLVKEQVVEDRLKMWQQLFEKYPDISETFRAMAIFKYTP